MDHEQSCKEISGELQDMADWLAGGACAPGNFGWVCPPLKIENLNVSV
jgi:hypothetical protein